MIATVEDAWEWYEAVRDLSSWMDRLARKYWDAPELDAILARDEEFKGLATEVIREKASRVLEDLDGLAVLLLFSVFEVAVRDKTWDDVSRELVETPQHPALIKSLDELKSTIESGSFGRLTEMYKAQNPDLKAQVDQVRKYRNWVAHGRRGDAENQVTPRAARERLRQIPRPHHETGLGNASGRLKVHSIPLADGATPRARPRRAGGYRALDSWSARCGRGI